MSTTERFAPKLVCRVRLMLESTRKKDDLDARCLILDPYRTSRHGTPVTARPCSRHAGWCGARSSARDLATTIVRCCSGTFARKYKFPTTPRDRRRLTSTFAAQTDDQHSYATSPTHSPPTTAVAQTVSACCHSRAKTPDGACPRFRGSHRSLQRSIMVVNETRKRLLRQLNSRYIYGRYVCVRHSKS